MTAGRGEASLCSYRPQMWPLLRRTNRYRFLRQEGHPDPKSPHRRCFSQFNAPPAEETQCERPFSSSGNQVNNQIKTITQSGGNGYVCAKSYPCRYGYVIVTITGTGKGALAQCTVSSAGGALNCEINNGSYSNGGEGFSVGDTLSINSSLVGGSGSGWSGAVTATSGADKNTTGLLADQMAVTAAWLAYVRDYNLKLFAYEGGESITVAGGSSPFLGSGLICAYDASKQAQAITSTYLNNWRNQVGEFAVFNYFTDVSSCTYPGSWGLLYTPQNTSAPKYQGALQQLATQPRPQSGVKR